MPIPARFKTDGQTSGQGSTGILIATIFIAIKAWKTGAGYLKGRGFKYEVHRLKNGWVKSK